MMLDNSKIIADFCPPTDDGDTFIYTEMLDRGKKKGNNGHRLMKTFFHRSVEEFWEQWPTIKRQCDLSMVRACTRLAPKSYKKVGKQLGIMTMEAIVAENWAGMKSLYNRACGITAPNTKIWLIDVDLVNEATAEIGTKINKDGNMLSIIPSKKGLHYIIKPFDVRILWKYCQEAGLTINGMTHEGAEAVSLHKDNPTNLYIPEGAD